MSGVVRGWCPNAWRPMAAGDGLLVRVRPRLGRLDADVDPRPVVAVRVLRRAAARGCNLPGSPRSAMLPAVPPQPLHRNRRARRGAPRSQPPAAG